MEWKGRCSRLTAELEEAHASVTRLRAERVKTPNPECEERCSKLARDLEDVCAQLMIARARTKELESFVAQGDDKIAELEVRYAEAWDTWERDQASPPSFGGRHRHAESDGGGSLASERPSARKGAEEKSSPSARKGAEGSPSRSVPRDADAGSVSKTSAASGAGLKTKTDHGGPDGGDGSSSDSSDESKPHPKPKKTAKKKGGGSDSDR